MNLPNITSGIPNVNGSTLSPAGEQFRVIKIVLYSLFLFIGTIGNTLVIAVLREKKRRTVNDYFIFNLAASDLIFIMLTHPIFLYEQFKTIPRNMFYCKGIWPLMSISLFVSIFTMTCMALERCRAVTHPFRKRTNSRNILFLLVCVWFGSILSILPLILVAEPSSGVLCNENWPNSNYRKSYTAVLFVLQYAVPLLIILVAYIRIGLHITSSRVPRTSVNHKGQLVRSQSRNENIQIIKSLAAIVFLFAVCMIPNQIAWMVMDFGKEEEKHLSEIFWEFSEVMIFLHSSLNPVVYGTLTHQFRRGYIKYIKLALCCYRPKVHESNNLDLSYEEVNGKTMQQSRNDFQTLSKTADLFRVKQGKKSFPYGMGFNATSCTADEPQRSVSFRTLNKIHNANTSQVGYSEDNIITTQVDFDFPSKDEVKTPGNSSPTISTLNLILDTPNESRKIGCVPTGKLKPGRAFRGKLLRRDNSVQKETEMGCFQGNTYINPGMGYEQDDGIVQETKL